MNRFCAIITGKGSGITSNAASCPTTSQGSLRPDARFSRRLFTFSTHPILFSIAQPPSPLLYFVLHSKRSEDALHSWILFVLE